MLSFPLYLFSVWRDLRRFLIPKRTEQVRTRSIAKNYSGRRGTRHNILGGERTVSDCRQQTQSRLPSQSISGVKGEEHLNPRCDGTKRFCDPRNPDRTPAGCESLCSNATGLSLLFLLQLARYLEALNSLRPRPRAESNAHNRVA